MKRLITAVIAALFFVPGLAFAQVGVDAGQRVNLRDSATNAPIGVTGNPLVVSGASGGTTSTPSIVGGSANTPFTQGTGAAGANSLNVATTPATGSVQAVTLTDGADTTLGAKADAAAGTGAVSLIALTKQLHLDLIGPTPAGSLVIGKVGIDQTTPGATNLVWAQGNIGYIDLVTASLAASASTTGTYRTPPAWAISYRCKFYNVQSWAAVAIYHSVAGSVSTNYAIQVQSTVTAGTVVTLTEPVMGGGNYACSWQNGATLSANAWVESGFTSN